MMNDQRAMEMSDLRFCAADAQRMTVPSEPNCLNCGGWRIPQYIWDKHKPFCKMKCGYEWAKKNSSQYKWCYVCGWYPENEYTEGTHEILG